MLYFEVTCQGKAAVIACENAKPAAVRAKAREEIRGYIGETPAPGSVRISPAKGMSAGELGERWAGYLSRLEFEADYIVTEVHFDFEIDDPSLSRMSPPKFRHYLGQDPDAHFVDPFGAIWKGVLNLLDGAPEDRLAFNRAFERLTAPTLNKHAIGPALNRARKLLEDAHAPEEVVGYLVDGYYVDGSQARQIVEHVLNPPTEPVAERTQTAPHQTDLFV